LCANANPHDQVLPARSTSFRSGVLILAPLTTSLIGLLIGKT
jgi:hypothetical protein